MFGRDCHNIDDGAEKTLETHDMALPSPGPSGQPVFFLIILLSISDMQNREQTMDRIERFSHLTGGNDIGLVFLLAASPRVNSMNAYMQLQTEYAHTSVLVSQFPSIYSSCPFTRQSHITWRN